jgi:hypothetical protein
MDIRTEYAARQAALDQQYASAMQRSRRLLLVLLGVLVVLLAAGLKVVYGVLPVWSLLVPFAALAIVEPPWRRSRRVWMRAARLLMFYERAAGRLEGTRAQSAATGDAYAVAGHLYQRDLGVLGADSLFGLLATMRTAVGGRSLAELLLGSVTAREARDRQTAVQELTPLVDLREEIELLGPSSFAEIPAQSFAAWLSLGGNVFQTWMRWALAAITTSWAALLAYGAFSHADVWSTLRNAAGLLAVQAAFALWLRPRVVAELDAAQRLAGQTAVLRDGLELLRRAPFTAPLLVELQEQASGEGPALQSLARLLSLTEQRAKEWFYLPSTLLGVGTHAAMALDAWRTTHSDALRRWVACWGRFEALVALAVYAREHEENAWPEILDSEGAEFAAEGLRHPLLACDAVANDVLLGGADHTRFLLISGSNMAGKSTLLRAVGLNAVLALCGAPVPARSLRLSALEVGAAIGVEDSLADGRSKFLAEVERLRDLLERARARHGQLLFLMDEIFAGTNSADRGVAAEAVVRGLVESGAIGALSTHDLALAGIAAHGGTNMHMASPHEDDPLAFDYLLKLGVNRTTNALAIVAMIFGEANVLASAESKDASNP